jgi:hypothetical protein
MWASTEPRLRQRRLATAILLALIATLGGPKAATAAGLQAEVNIHGSAEEVQKLESTLRSLFPADARVQVSAVDAVDGAQVMQAPLAPSPDGAPARAWIELHDGSRVTIYVVDVAGERILVRHLPRTDEDGELVREATARIVATALEALLSGAQIGVERARVAEELTAPPTEKTPPTSPPLARAPAAPSYLALTLGAQYGMQLYSSQVPVVHGPGVIFGGSFGAHPTRPGALLIGQIWWPSRAHDDVASVRVYSGALRLLATVERSFGASVIVGAGLGAGLDLTRVEPAAERAATSVRLASPTTLTTPALRASLSAKFRQPSGFSLYTTFALDADPSRTRYVSLNDGVTSRMLQPYALRPSLVVGVAAP